MHIHILSLSLSLSLSTMSLPTQKQILSRFIQRMCDEGIVNAEFCQLQEMKDAAKPDFVVRAVTLYCLAAHNLFSRMSIQIEQPEVNFYEVEASARDLFDRTSSIGAEHVKIACADIVHASQACDKDHCSRALYWTKNEFSILRRDFESLVQLERKIIDLENGNEARVTPTYRPT